MQTAMVTERIYPETIGTIAYTVPVIAASKDNPENMVNLTDLTGPGVRGGVTRAETTLLGKFDPEIFAKAGLTEEIGPNIVTEAVRPDSLMTAIVMGQVDAVFSGTSTNSSCLKISRYLLGT